MEYWMFSLFHLLIGLGLALAMYGIVYVSDNRSLPHVLMIITVMVLYLLVMAIPSLAVTARRLHDIGQSGWLLLISLLPYLGGLILLILCCLPGNPGPNIYGPDPMGEINGEQNVITE